MKKVLIGCAAMAFILSACKEVPQGGNKGVIKVEEGVERYDDHEVRASQPYPSAVAMDSTATEAPQAAVSDTLTAE